MKKSSVLAVLEKLPADYKSRSEVNISENGKFLVFGSISYVSIPLRKIRHFEIRPYVVEIDFRTGYFRSWLSVDSAMMVIN